MKDKNEPKILYDDSLFETMSKKIKDEQEDEKKKKKNKDEEEG